jgi:tight adherence protein B
VPPLRPAEPEPAVTPAEPTITVRQPGLLQQPGTLWAGVALVGLALLVLAVVVAAPTGPRLRLHRPERGETGVRQKVVDVAERAISVQNRSRIDLALERADSNLRSAEFVALVGIATLIVSALGLLIGGGWFVLAGLLVPLAARVGLERWAVSRRNRFADQLPETLQLLSGSLRAGRALPQALEMLANESPQPTAGEFGRVVIETRVGRDLVESLERSADRVDNEDFRWVVRAIAINRELGGDLAEVLDNVAETIRDRAQIARHVRSLSAEGRMSAWVLLGLPVVVALIVSRTNPGYLDVLFTRTIGLAMVFGGLALFALGGLWIRRIISLTY